MNPLCNQVFTEPVPEGITLTLDPQHLFDNGEMATAITVEVLATALQTMSPRTSWAWTVRQVAHSTGLLFDLTPLPGQVVSVKEVWDLSYALAAQPQVLAAKPSFVILQDDFIQVAQATKPAPDAVAAMQLMQTTEMNPAWIPNFIEAPQAWLVPPRPAQDSFPSGRSRGAGIRIGHPDSGYRAHVELFDTTPSRVRTDLAKDFVDDAPAAVTLDGNWDGNHGLGTASVLISNETGCITGVAPAAELVPLRVAQRHPVESRSTLLASGARGLRDAIYYAISPAVNCQVISISLGWLFDRFLHEAIRAATEQNVIICAAAGNYMPFVVWPASYPEVIAVAGCTAQREPWGGSSTGPSVAVSAPAQQIWIAAIDDEGQQCITQSNGTAYAVTAVAGIAALWLAQHGRDFLLDRYAGAFTLTEVFRHVLKSSCEQFQAPPVGGFGAGIVNARKVLEAPLPTLAALHAALPTPAIPMPPTPIAQDRIPFTAVFDPLPAAVAQHQLATLFNLPADQLYDRLAAVSDELLFHIVTTPELRQALAHDSAVAVPAIQANEVASLFPQIKSTSAFASLRRMISRRFSDRLQRALKP